MSTSNTGSEVVGVFLQMLGAVNAARRGADPSEAQKLVGNYKKGRFYLFGMPVVIECPHGTTRSGVSEDGRSWSNRMGASYGYIAGTRGADGDEVDVFVGPIPESTRAWVINQCDAAGEFDEAKVMLGFATEEQAKNAYLTSYDKGWRGLMSMAPIGIPTLKQWLKTGDMTSPYLHTPSPEGNQPMSQVQWGADALPSNTSMAQVIYNLRRQDGSSGLMLDAASMDEVMDDPMLDGAEPMVLDAMVIEVGRMKQKMLALERVFQAIGSHVKPVSFSISNPVKARGVLQVAVVFKMSDGQSVTVWFHNAEQSPARLTPLDELISWRWLLNKMDITILVAPERGKDLVIREVARRVMRLVDRNSEAFAKANAKAAEMAAQHANIDQEITELNTKLTVVRRKIEDARIERAIRDEEEIAAAASTPAERVVAEVQETVAAPAVSGEVVAADAIVAEEAAGQSVEEAVAKEAATVVPPDLVKLEDAPDAALEEALVLLGDPNSLMRATFERTVEGVAASVHDCWPKNELALRYFNASEIQAELKARVDAREAEKLAATEPELPVWMSPEFDPTTAEGYEVVRESDEALLYWQDRLDAFFQIRYVDIRNALRELGWDGPDMGDLSKAGYSLSWSFRQVGAGKNIVGLSVAIRGDGDLKGEVGDSLTKSAIDLAAVIDGYVDVPNPAPQEEVATPGPIVEPVLEAEVAPVVTLSGSEFGEFDDTPEGKKALRGALKEYLESLRGEWVDCPILGDKVEIRRRGIKETLAFTGDPRKMRIVAGLKGIIHGARAVEEQPNYALLDKPQVQKYFILTAPVSLAGQILPVRVVIEQDQDGKLYYDLMLDKGAAGLVKKETALGDPSAASVPTLPPDNDSGNAGEPIMDAVGDGVNAERDQDQFNLDLAAQASGAILDSAKANGSSQDDPFAAANSNDGGTDPSRMASDQPGRTVSPGDAAVKGEAKSAGESKSGNSASAQILDEVGGAAEGDEVLNLFVEGEDPGTEEVTDDQVVVAEVAPIAPTPDVVDVPAEGAEPVPAAVQQAAEPAPSAEAPEELEVPAAYELTQEEYGTIAATILQQLGGAKFKVMTGASKFAFLSAKAGGAPYGGLTFSLPSSFAKGGINRVTIRLNSMDTYDLEFGRIRGVNYTVQSTAEGVYVENLQEVFTDRTGLDTSLGLAGPILDSVGEVAGDSVTATFSVTVEQGIDTWSVTVTALSQADAESMVAELVSSGRIARAIEFVSGLGEPAFDNEDYFDALHVVPQAKTITLMPRQ